MLVFQGLGEGGSPAEILNDGPVLKDNGAPNVASTDGQKRVMCLMSDTGGGHRASAQALKDGFEVLYGESAQGLSITFRLSNLLGLKAKDL